MHKIVYPWEATSTKLYPYVCLKFGGKWVFQSILEQEGYVNIGMFFMSFSDVGTTLSLQHVDSISDTWTGLTF